MTLKDNIKKYLCELMKLIFNGIGIAVIASLLTTFIITNVEYRNNINDQLKNISNIYIGCNKQWADEKFGSPQFSGEKEGYMLCAYVTDYFVVQMIFDNAMSAQAYSITALNNEDDICLQINDRTLSNKESYTLGEFSYYDFPGTPEYVVGAVSNGNARATYYEKYYFTSQGNYYNYYIGFLDYGKTEGTIQGNIHKFAIVDGDIDDEVSAEKNRGLQIISNRHDCFPNTYAVSNINDDMIDNLFSYYWFNSQQLRNSMVGD